MSTSTSDSSPERPARMWRNGRPEDHQFDADEHLFHRVVKEDVSSDRILPASISYKNMSVNRQRYSEPEDVTFGYPGTGVARFVVEMVMRPVTSETGGKPWEFRPAHVPDDDNYAHSEVWAFKDDLRVTEPNPPNPIKKKYRTMMSDHSLVIIPPSI